MLMAYYTKDKQRHAAMPLYNRSCVITPEPLMIPQIARGITKQYKAEFSIWEGFRRRCSAPHRKDYKNYGGRGIKVCERWQGKNGFANFLTDMGTRPLGTQLDRINNDGNYEPGNCRWTDKRTQMMNRRLSEKNKSGFVGVRVTESGKYRAEICVYCKTIMLGTFANIEDAIQARKQAEKRYAVC